MRVKSMVIQNNKISPTLNGADQAEKISVPVPNARDGRVSQDKWDSAMECAVPGMTGSSTVYTEAQARQGNNNTVEFLEDSGMSPADFISRCMTGEDAMDLSDEGTPLEEYTSSQLERAISRIKEQRSEKRQSVEGQVDREREEEKARESSALENLEKSGVPDTILKKMQESGLPLADDNVWRLVHAVNLTAQRNQITPASMEFFVRNEFNVTPENISGSVYGGSAGRQSAHASQTTAYAQRMTAYEERMPEEEESFEQVRGQVATILEEGGIGVTDASMETAKWLYDNDLAVTAENVRACQQLEQLREMDDDTILSRIVDGIVDGFSAEKADLTKMSREEASRAIRQFTETDDGVLRQTYSTEADFVRARRQMEEIRLSMTIEAARAMSAKGIQLDVSNLEKIVEELRVQEKEAENALLEETGLPVTETNARQMADTIYAAENVLTAPAVMLGTTLQNNDLTLSGMSEEATQHKDQFARMEAAYEAVGTEVRRDLGDSLNKAFGNIDEILKDLGLETTGMNQRAVRILAYNQMPLTAESIEQMKAYDDKVTTLMRDLKPPVVAELIRQEINPLELSLEELNTAVQEIRGSIEDEDISFRRFLWKMDHQGGLTSEERQSMIGVYRLLDKVEKSDGAVIGKVIKEGRELSLSSLLSATRTRKAEGMDISVDEQFGGLEDTVQEGTAIDEQIRAAYGASVVEKLRQNLSPKVLRDAGQELFLEELLERCMAQGETDEEMRPYYQEMADRVTAAMTDPEGQVMEFLQALSMPDSAASRMLAMEYLSNGFKEYGRLWKKSESDTLLDSFGEPDELDSVYEQLDDIHQQELVNQKENDDITYADAFTLAKMAGGISFYQNLRSQQTYEVPIVTERGVTACHVTIQTGSGKKGTVEISLDSDELGKVQATFRVSGSHVKGFVTAERTDRMDICQKMLEGFEKDLEEKGFTTDSDSLIQGSRRSLHRAHETHADRTAGTKNRDLYQVAKCFLVNVKRQLSGKEDET